MYFIIIVPTHLLCKYIPIKIKNYEHNTNVHIKDHKLNLYEILLIIIMLSTKYLVQYFNTGLTYLYKNYEIYMYFLNFKVVYLVINFWVAVWVCSAAYPLNPGLILYVYNLNFFLGNLKFWW